MNHVALRADLYEGYGSLCNANTVFFVVGIVSFRRCLMIYMTVVHPVLVRLNRLSMIFSSLQ